MQRKDWFENWLRSKIGGDRPLLQPDLTWQKIQQRRDRRRVLFLWLCGGLGLAASGGWGGYFYFQGFEKMGVPATPIAENQQGLNVEPSKISEKRTYSAPATSEKMTSEKSNICRKTTATAPTTSEKSHSFQPYQQDHSPLHAIEASSTSKQKFDFSEVAGAGGRAFLQTLDFSKIPDSAAEKHSSESKSQIFQTQNLPLNPLPLPLIFVKTIARDSVLPPTDTLKLRFKLKINFEEQVNIPFKISIELSGGYGSNFLLQQSSQLRDWQDLRQRQETPLDAVSAQFLLRADLGKHFFLASGLGFWQWTDRRRSGQVDSSFTQTLGGQVVKIIRYADGTEETVLDTVQATVNHHTTAIEYNRYRRFEIPVAVGWRFFPQKKWSLETSAGMAFGFRTPSSGWLANKNLQGKVSLKNNIYLQQGTLAGFGRVALTRTFGKTAFGLGIQGRWEFRNMGRLASELLETRASVGLNLSVRRAF